MNIISRRKKDSRTRHIRKVGRRANVFKKRQSKENLEFTGFKIIIKSFDLSEESEEETINEFQNFRIVIENYEGEEPSEFDSFQIRVPAMK